MTRSRQRYNDRQQNNTREMSCCYVVQFWPAPSRWRPSAARTAHRRRGVFTLTSPSFKDGERLATKNAGNNKSNPNCVGENISPALAWANPPEGTKSYALLMFDPEGRPPGGVSHWVAYGIPAVGHRLCRGRSLQAERQICRRHRARMKLSHLFRALHAARRAASLHLHADRDRPRADGAAGRHDARRADQGARRPRQGRDRPDRHVLEAVSSPSTGAAIRMHRRRLAWTVNAARWRSLAMSPDT